jgi:hypothetical protein
MNFGSFLNNITIMTVEQLIQDLSIAVTKGQITYDSLVMVVDEVAGGSVPAGLELPDLPTDWVVIFPIPEA